MSRSLTYGSPQDESLFTVCDPEEEEGTGDGEEQPAAGSALRELLLQPLESATECVAVTAGQTAGTAQPGSYTVIWNRSVQSDAAWGRGRCCFPNLISLRLVLNVPSIIDHSVIWIDLPLDIRPIWGGGWVFYSECRLLNADTLSQHQWHQIADL